ncbi:YfiR family protein [Lacisediminimonas profundi]|uniref:YfiR family protein n=1 Tax=Lacisediminimonas profundi TaxID=2603856 RepID=UPI0019D52D8A|nr:YfiR family protein [Lacisediminimonas profundi]
MAALAALCPALAQADEIRAERLVKTAYLFHFSGLVEWPDGSFASPDSPLRVGIMGADDIADELVRMIASRQLQGRPIIVSKLKPSAPRSMVHMLFIGDSLREQLPDILDAVKGQPVLTITQTENALAFGSMINFLSIDGSLRFEISQQAPAQARLTISSRLLSVSHKFSPGSPKFR